MTDRPLYIAFIWHMHQPYYKDPRTGDYRLPWVRLHGTKDYLDMVEILNEFPTIKQNFNLVPSLLDQLIDYADHDAQDVYLKLSRQKAATLSDRAKQFILENFFLAHWENMIKPFPKYYELLVKRGTHFIKSELPRTIKYFSSGDFLDLQVFFNLCWIDPLFRDNDPFLKTLCEKGHGYSEEEKEILLAKQLEIMRRIIPAYKEIAARGQAELSFTPFYHPILPLLCNTDISRVAMPEVRLPRKRFSHPEDAERQIEMGRQYFEKVFNYSPSGMWPSEGSVSEEVVRIASRQGVRWMATDEGVLENSLQRRLRDQAGNLLDPQALYRSYSYEDVSLVFRDHLLSDLIGFVYSQWDPQRAAEDLMNRLLHIRSTLPGDRPHLVSIILDGENAWEHYRNDGRDFFLALYRALSSEKRLKTITVSEFINNVDRGEKLDRLHPGSWINANYGIWIGHEEDNLSWDYLTETRDRLEDFEKSNSGVNTEKAWKSIYVAEGSDWNWWYGDEHTTETQEDFDELFRLNLMQVYKEMGKDVPPQLFVPVLRHDRTVLPTQTIRGFIRPKIDGLVTSYFEWYQGAEVDVKKSGGSMHKSEGLISMIHYGFNQETLFIRVDPKVPFEQFEEGIDFSIITSRPQDVKISCPVRGEGIEGVLFEKAGEEWRAVRHIHEVACLEVFEIGIPFADLKANPEDEIHFFISVRKENSEMERCPWRGHITVTVPTENFEAMMWY